MNEVQKKINGAEDTTYRKIVEQMQEGALVTDIEGIILYSNASFASMMMCDHKRILGSSIFEYISEKDSDAFKKLFAEGIVGKSHGEIELSGDRKFPGYIFVNAIDETEAGDLSIVIADLSLEREKEHFRRIIDDNKKMMARIEEEDKKKDEFIATLAHELRNPLAPLLSTVEIFKEYIDESAKVGQRREIDQILEQSVGLAERQIKKMSRLLEDLLDISRIAHGKIVLKKERFDINQAVNDAVETVRPLMIVENFKFNLSLPPSGSIYLKADKIRVEQIFINILNNAIKFTPEGGSISINVDRSGDKVVITIEDSGIGIPAEKLETIFKPFIQTKNNQKIHGGLGLGLALAKNISQLHGGRIVVSSAGTGLGSVFRIYLPIEEEMGHRES